MEDVLAPDDRSVVVRWKSIYPDAGVLLGAARFGLVPLFTILSVGLLAAASPTAPRAVMTATPTTATNARASVLALQELL